MAAHKGRRGHPRRSFRPFWIAPKGARRRGGEIPPNQKVRHKTGRRAKPLPYGCQRVQMGRAGLGPAPTAGQMTTPPSSVTADTVPPFPERKLREEIAIPVDRHEKAPAEPVLFLYSPVATG